MTGQELRNKLKKKGIVLAKLAAKLEMTPSNLSRRLDVAMIDYEFLRQIEDVLGVNLSDDETINTKETTIPYSVYKDLKEENRDLKDQNKKMQMKIEVLLEENKGLYIENAKMQGKMEAIDVFRKEKDMKKDTSESSALKGVK